MHSDLCLPRWSKKQRQQEKKDVSADVFSTLMSPTIGATVDNL